MIWSAKGYLEALVSSPRSKLFVARISKSWEVSLPRIRAYDQSWRWRKTEVLNIWRGRNLRRRRENILFLRLHRHPAKRIKHRRDERVARKIIDETSWYWIWRRQCRRVKEDTVYRSQNLCERLADVQLPIVWLVYYFVHFNLYRTGDFNAYLTRP